MRLGVALGALLVLASFAQPVAEEPGDPYAATRGLYVDHGSLAARWVDERPNDPRAERIGSEIAAQPTGKWFGGSPRLVGGAVHAHVSAAAAVDELPVLVAYNIPSRACGQYDSDGGADSPQEYRDWIRAFAAGIGTTPAVVVLEPDSLLLLEGCLDRSGQQERVELLRDAVGVLRQSAPAAWVYLDGSDGRHTDPAIMADRLRRAGVADTRGFALGVSNYNDAALLGEYARRLVERLGPDAGAARAVIDVGRSGAGGAEDWCNPAGQTLGAVPRVGGEGNIDAQLWIKPPGETDGDCGIGRWYGDAGFVPELAMDLLPPG